MARKRLVLSGFVEVNWERKVVVVVTPDKARESLRETEREESQVGE